MALWSALPLMGSQHRFRDMRGKCVPCLHAQFRVVSVSPTWSFTSASTFLHRNKPFLDGSSGCLSTWDPGQIETSESLLSACLLSAQRVKTLCSFLSCDLALTRLCYFRLTSLIVPGLFLNTLFLVWTRTWLSYSWAPVSFTHFWAY